MTSAYPIPNDVLEERVRALSTSLGGWPSQRRVMRECRVGAPRADAALAAVKRSGFDPSTPARPLSLVPDTTSPAAVENTATGTTTAPDTTAPDTTGPAPVAPDSDRAVSTGGAGEAGQVNRPAETPSEAPADTAPDAPTDKTGDETAEAAATSAAVLVGGGGVRLPRWPMVLIALGAFVAIWGGWVGLGELTGFGPIRLLPGIWDEFVINSAITLPIGMEAYAAFALRTWLAPPEAGLSRLARRFACWSALGALALGAAGQIAYHLMVAAGLTQAPWQITAFVSCLPVLVLACAAALTHLTHTR